ncbi:MAG: IS110 family transposase [Candidatus Competibacteraceae bacterium]|nr:IS110 family transposase [Candidatus Competibacteraceae bacterium]
MVVVKGDNSKAKKKKKKTLDGLERINLNAAGIDVGSTEHWVAVPSGRDPKPVRRFGTFSADLRELCAWLKDCKIDTVAMEATGIYWTALYGVLESAGIQVVLANARHARNVPGRKSDQQDCQWLQQLHTFGLLNASFIPESSIRAFRSFLRQRESLVQAATREINHMQKALTEMNLRLGNVLSDITGQSGLNILDAILAGERDPHALAGLCSKRIHASRQTVAKSLEGEYRPEQLFILGQALEGYRFCQAAHRSL